MIIKVNFNVSLQCANCGVRLSFVENTDTDKYDSILEVEPHVCGVLTQRAADSGDGLPNISPELLECGHSVSYIVYSERRNYCGICDRDAHRKNPAFGSPRSH